MFIVHSEKQCLCTKLNSLVLDNHSDVVANLQKYLCNFCTVTQMSSVHATAWRKEVERFLAVFCVCWLFCSFVFAIFSARSKHYTATVYALLASFLLGDHR